MVCHQNFAYLFPNNFIVVHAEKPKLVVITFDDYVI